MTSYGDSTNSAHGRARVPGSGSGYDPEPEYGEPTYGTSTRTPGEGTGAIGSASVRPSSTAAAGRASVSGASGRASVGRAGVSGRASVGGYGDGGYSGDVMAGPGGPGDDGYDRPEDFDRGPGGPAGPGGPGGRMAARGGKGKGPRSKRSRRRNIILASVAVFIILSGLVVVGGAYYYDSIPEPNQISLPESTTVYYNDNQTPMAKLGKQNRTIIDKSQMPKYVQDAVVAAEDNSFYDNHGVDFKGILRAAWNNVTGGSRQGASTITQQYVRNAFNLKGVSYGRKAREAVMAVKMDQKYKKEDIMAFYLNTVYFGRGSYGIEAAAESYFGKHAKDLTIEEGMVLASVIKQPEGDDGFDPAKNLQNAQDRWNNYVKPTMVKLHFLDEAKAAQLKYPINILKPDASSTSAAEYGKDTPTGFVIHHVMDELSHQTVVKLGDLKKEGGYRIVTTISKPLEDDAIKVADPTVQGSVMSTQPPRLQAALVAIEPMTGRVLAYYGGHDGSGLDHAGIYSDPVLDDGTPSGAHFPPGSTMKVYTMTTALSQRISIDSYWDGPPSKVFPGRGDAKAKATNGAPPVTNSDGDSCPKPSFVCTMQYALQVSTNTVFYGVGVQVGPDKIIETAHAMGVNHIWDIHGKRQDLHAGSGKELYPSLISPEVAIGQFGITVQDNASGMATLAAGGVHAETHFVDFVYKGGALVYRAPTRQQKLSDPNSIGLTKEEVDDATWAMSTVIENGMAKNRLAGGRQAASKTGTWQLCDEHCAAADRGKNSDAWYAGFTPQLATVVHIGSKDPKDRSIAYYSSGKKETPMNGANTPGDVWKKFMDLALAGQKKVPLPSPKHVGRVDAGNAPSPEPSAPPTDQPPGDGQPCQLPTICVSTPPTPDPSASKKRG